jgi:hypothetical protein
VNVTVLPETSGLYAEMMSPASAVVSRPTVVADSAVVV